MVDIMKDKMARCYKEKFQLWSGMKVVVPSKSVPNQKWRCDPMRSDKSHLLIIKEEKNQVVIIKISQGTHSKRVPGSDRRHHVTHVRDILVIWGLSVFE